MTDLPACSVCGARGSSHKDGKCAACRANAAPRVEGPDAESFLVRIVQAHTQARSGEEREAIREATVWLVRRNVLTNFGLGDPAKCSVHGSGCGGVVKCGACGSRTYHLHGSGYCSSCGAEPAPAIPAAPEVPYCRCVGLMMFEGGLCVRCGGRDCRPEPILPPIIRRAAPPAAPAACHILPTTDDEAKCFEHDRLAQACVDEKDARIAALGQENARLAKEVEVANLKELALKGSLQGAIEMLDLARAEVEKLKGYVQPLVDDNCKWERRAESLQAEVERTKKVWSEAEKDFRDQKRRASQAEKESENRAVNFAEERRQRLAAEQERDALREENVNIIDCSKGDIQDLNGERNTCSNPDSIVEPKGCLTHLEQKVASQAKTIEAMRVLADASKKDCSCEMHYSDPENCPLLALEKMARAAVTPKDDAQKKEAD